MLDESANTLYLIHTAKLAFKRFEENNSKTAVHLAGKTLAMSSQIYPGTDCTQSFVCLQSCIRFDWQGLYMCFYSLLLQKLQGPLESCIHSNVCRSNTR